MDKDRGNLSPRGLQKLRSLQTIAPKKDPISVDPLETPSGQGTCVPSRGTGFWPSFGSSTAMRRNAKQCAKDLPERSSEGVSVISYAKKPLRPILASFVPQCVLPGSSRQDSQVRVKLSNHMNLEPKFWIWVLR